MAEALKTEDMTYQQDWILYRITVTFHRRFQFSGQKRNQWTLRKRIATLRLLCFARNDINFEKRSEVTARIPRLMRETKQSRFK
jgi:hypothetical protein